MCLLAAWLKRKSKKNWEGRESAEEKPRKSGKVGGGSIPVSSDSEPLRSLDAPSSFFLLLKEERVDARGYPHENTLNPGREAGGPQVFHGLLG